MKQFSRMALAASLLLAACATSETHQDTTTVNASLVVDTLAKARLDSTLQAQVTSGQVAGVSALVFEKGEEVYFNAFGMADREENVPMARNTLVQIFSMTKPITGVALMQLYEQGKFQLDDPVANYIPEFANLQVYAGNDAAGQPVLEAPHRPMLVRDLTRHTSGLTSGPDTAYVGALLKKVDPMNRENTLTQMAEKFAQAPLWFQPGAQWAYGPSVDVQALLVERLSGQPFDQYVQEHIFGPLGMDETRYFIPEADRDRFAALYLRNDSTGLTRVPDSLAHALNTRHWPLTPGGFGFTSTVDDYMRFARMLVNEGELDGTRILKPETVELMATNQLPDSVTERSWLPSKGRVGFGIDFAVRVSPPQTAEENNGVVGEFFWDGAASTLFWVDPANELTAVLFVQIMPFYGQLHKQFRDAVYGPYTPTATP
ncbi:CubicO group peptidase, beta-lactamase class C family [Catalinimonas alkaloidigena]|uniref:CubicO group peptidase, beta-lactamase class C family n=1 Tax=Catalinimonas alkaloidigena TaxID=1075417 RepID=A0A1G8YIA3_9BACT|nr:serine hydrolase domain-containing protein [Catalinimonas alkaloidigena]SDK02476.1 CubicO group peptidase, beta-lactamase class C family [Catalinimonas alkaloidigena]